MAWRDKTRRRKRKPMFQCGSCGKRHNNPFGHRCTGGGGLKRKRAAAARQQAAADQRARERKIRADERAVAAQRVRQVRAAERRKAAARVAAARKKRPAGPRKPHNWRTCRDAECEQRVCEAYRDGLPDEDGE